MLYTKFAVELNPDVLAPVWCYEATAVEYSGADDEEREVGSGNAYYIAFSSADEVSYLADAISHDVHVKAEAFLRALKEDSTLDGSLVSGVVFLDQWRVLEEHRGRGVGYKMARDLCELPWPCGTVFVLQPGPIPDREDDNDTPDSSAVTKLQEYWSEFGFYPLDESSGDALPIYGHHDYLAWLPGSHMGEKNA